MRLIADEVKARHGAPRPLTGSEDFVTMISQMPPITCNDESFGKDLQFQDRDNGALPTWTKSDIKWL